MLMLLTSILELKSLLFLRVLESLILPIRFFDWLSRVSLLDLGKLPPMVVEVLQFLKLSEELPLHHDNLTIIARLHLGHGIHWR